MLISLPLFLFYHVDLMADSKPTKKVAFVGNNLLTIRPVEKSFLTRIARIAFLNTLDNECVGLVWLVK